jgi:hypothetical protein
VRPGIRREPPGRLRLCFYKEEFYQFLGLIITVGMLRNELIEWAKQQHDQ